MGVLPQALEIIFEVQRKMINEKIIRTKKKTKQKQKHDFILFPSLWILLISNLITFLFLIHFKQFKVL
jgi:hypothetical protein